MEKLELFQNGMKVNKNFKILRYVIIEEQWIVRH